MKQSITIDLNVTGQCNLRCSYCIESGQYTLASCEAIVPEFCAFIDRLVKAEYSVTIGFWGGEPTLKPEVLANIVNRYRDNIDVKFMIYTNGFNLSPEVLGLIYSLKDIIINGSPKFFTQISYDGMPIQDVKRQRGSKGTSDEVRSTIRWASQNGIPYSIKSTIPVDMLKHLFEAYTDINDLSGSRSGYYPSLDYFNDLKDTGSLDQNLQEMRDNLKRIAAYMLSAKRKGQPCTDFKWFTNSKSDCTAGINMFSVDITGLIYVCHGCFYSSKKADHFIGYITDPISILDTAREKHMAFEAISPAECQTCEATFCARCNTARYSISEKETYGERWKDYTNNPTLCRIFKEIGLVSRAYQKLLNSNAP
jgi:sulfatase maturation enzyme AslB (radical SAM superfamily)